MEWDFAAIAYTVSTWVLPALFAITLHEAAHGFVAWWLGDPTAYEAGRVTLNPIKHIDPFGTFVLPALLIISPLPFVFGYAKPVPVAMHRLPGRHRDMVLVAAAGPAANLFLALVSALLLHLATVLPEAASTWLVENLLHSILLNLLLAVFNLLPLPPLDGGRIAVGLLPMRLAYPLARLERYGLLILIAALFLLPYLSRQLGTEVRLFHILIWQPVEWMIPFFLRLGGMPLS